MIECAASGRTAELHVRVDDCPLQSHVVENVLRRLGLGMHAAKFGLNPLHCDDERH